MANSNYNQSTQLFPSARAMKAMPTSVASGVVPGVNTLTKSTDRSQIQSMQYLGGKLGKAVPRTAAVPYTSSVVSVGGTSLVPVAATQNLSEEQLQQKVFAARMMGAPLAEMSQIAGSGQGALLPPTRTTPINQVPVQQQPSPSLSMQSQQQQPWFTNQMQQQNQPQQPLHLQQQVRMTATAPSIIVKPISALKSQGIQSQFSQQRHFPQQQQQLPQQQQLSQQQSFQHKQPRLAATYTGRKKRNDKNTRWEGNISNNSNKNAVRSVKGVSGSSQEHKSAWPIEKNLNTGPGLLGAFPTSQSSSTQVSKCQPGAFHSADGSTSIASSSSKGMMTPAVDSNNMVISTLAVVQTRPPQVSIMDILKGLNSFEAEKLRKALLSGNTDNLGLTSAHALDILQALKSIKSGTPDSRKEFGKSAVDEISTNWPGTDEVWKGPRLMSKATVTDPSRGLGTILEMLRSSQDVNDKFKSGGSSNLIGYSESSPDSPRVNNNLALSGDINHLQTSFPSGLPIMRLPSKDNTTITPSVGLFATSTPTSDAIPFLSEFRGEHAISTIAEKETMRKDERASDGKYSIQRHTSKQRKTSNGETRHTCNLDNKYDGEGHAWSQGKKAGDRNRLDDRQRDRERNRPYRDHSTSLEREDDRRVQSYRRAERRKRGYHSLTRKEGTRSGSRERKEHGSRGTAGDDRDRLNHHEGQNRREESPIHKRTKTGQSNNKEPTAERNSSGRSNQGVTTPCLDQHKMVALENKKSTTDTSDGKQLSSKHMLLSETPQDNERKQEMLQSNSKLQPLMEIVTSKQSEIKSSTSKFTSISTSKKPSNQTSAMKDDSTHLSTSASSDTKTAIGEQTKKKKKKNNEGKLTVEEANKVAGTLKDTPLINHIGESSISHQLSQLKEIKVDQYVKTKELVDWYCYVCGMFCHSWTVYITHVEGRKHKAMFQKLHEIGHGALKKVLISKLKELPEKGQGDPDKWITVRQPNFDHRQLSQLSIKSIPGDSEQIYFCRRCFRTYIGSHEDHLESPEHKKYEQIRPKCKVCNLTFVSYKYYQRHLQMPTHAVAENNFADSVSEKDGLKDSEQMNDEGYEEKEKGKKKQTQQKNITGPEFIIPISGYFCKLCSKFYNKEKAAKEYHCSTSLHDQKVKQYYTSCIKSSVASLKASPGILVNEAKPSSMTTIKKDNLPQKEARNIQKEPKLEEVLSKQSSPKLVLSIPKMSSSKIAALKAPYSQASKKTKVIPAHCATPECVAPKSTALENTTHKHVSSKTTMHKSTSETSRNIFSTSFTTACSRVTTTSSRLSTGCDDEFLGSKVSDSKENSVDNITNSLEIKESDIQKNQEEKSDSIEIENESDDEQDLDWFAEMPDFDDMISIDEVGESDDEGGASQIIEGDWEVVSETEED